MIFLIVSPEALFSLSEKLRAGFSGATEGIRLKVKSLSTQNVRGIGYVSRVYTSQFVVPSQESDSEGH